MTLAGWIEATLGHRPVDEALFAQALTHGSTQAQGTYERLEFLGDRVLGLLVAEWLYQRHPGEAEGALSRRLNALVARPTCGAVGRAIGVPARVRLGKQALGDGAADSDNVLGDVVEALIGALFLDGGLDAARRFVRTAWGALVDDARAPRHPKSALQEWAAANRRRAPAYTLVERSGPHHAPRFTVAVAIGDALGAQASGSSKQEAETAAAAALLERLET